LRFAGRAVSRYVRWGTHTTGGLLARVVVMGAHPDDPDSGAGGLMALLSRSGHEVVAVSFTRGELTGRWSVEENAKVNEEEAVTAFELLGARVTFLNFRDGSVWVTEEVVTEVLKLLRELRPEVVLTHWPVDTHSDHRSVGAATIGAVRRLEEGSRPALFFYEVMTGIQTRCFHPDIYVDVSEVAELKRRACYLHRNCFPDKWYPVHEDMMRFRGLEMGVKCAEAFASFDKSRARELVDLLRRRNCIISMYYSRPRGAQERSRQL